MKTEFDITPPDEELSELSRDLRFYPASTKNPQVLNVEQIEQFNRDGYLRPFRIFDEPEIAEIRRYFDRLLEETLAAGKDSYSISTAHMRYGRVYDLLTDPRIVALDLLEQTERGVVASARADRRVQPRNGFEVVVVNVRPRGTNRLDRRAHLATEVGREDFDGGRRRGPPQRLDHLDELPCPTVTSLSLSGKNRTSRNRSP